MNLNIVDIESAFDRRFARRLRRRTNSSAKEMDRFIKAVVEVRAEMSRDHADCFSKFMQIWRIAVVNVDGLADAVMEHASVAVAEGGLKAFLAAYDFRNHLIYGTLVGSFAYPEEVEFVMTAERLENAWRKLFGIVRVRARSPEAAIDATERAVMGLHGRIVRIYRSLETPLLDAAWMAGFETAQAGLVEILKGLES